MLAIRESSVDLVILDPRTSSGLELGQARELLVRHPTLPVVIYQLVSRPDDQSFGMALAASVVLSLVTVAVMGLVERLRLGSMGAF